MFRRAKAFLLAENLISLDILILGVLTLATIFSFGQLQLHHEEQQMLHYLSAEQAAMHQPKAKLPAVPKTVTVSAQEVHLIWPNQSEVWCRVQT